MKIKQLILFIININNKLHDKPINNILNDILDNKLVDNIKITKNYKINDYDDLYNKLVNKKTT